jgi:hypothetical protein
MTHGPLTADLSPLAFRLAHSLLLSRFVSPAAPRLDVNARGLSEWTAALKDPPESAIERFKRANLLVPFSPSTPEALSQALASIYGAAQLSTMLKARGLKTSGRKGELIARLVDADRETLLCEISALELYHCSDAGRRLASRLAERKQQAHGNAVAAISAKDYARAIREYQAIEDDLGFPKREFEGSPKSELIELVMTVTPTILDGCSEEVMSQLRMAMALQCLSARHAPKNLFRGVDTGIRLDAETAARMIYFLARHTEDIEKWKQMRITQVTHFAAAGYCSVCTNSNGQEWRIDQAPELPHALCTHQYGCRCLHLPVSSS